ncbi:Ig-like domain-containing protein [Fulvimonas sp. R45]|uniref:Ig-like domain-containing protein n=1 Tax=Fulvimonas sp. R45 TaxID=3045937 RepID=UPI00265DDFA3|nr:Ig-like domain-containing protein [Fulvimonas sp. R45]MDO1530354.1 Ig-like domain-containing protein [Fulvimonas sp. R45]
MAWFKRTTRKPTASDAPAAGTSLPPRRPLALALEPRVMFDGAAVVTAAQFTAPPPAHAAPAAHDVAHDVARHEPAALLPHELAQRVFHDPGDHDAAAHAATAGGRNVLFVDARVQDAGELLAHVRPGTEVVYLDQGRDGLTQMRDYLDAHPGAASVQIIAHGNDGDLWLGGTYLSADNIGQHAGELARIGADMRPGGDILIYACNTAAGDKGAAFVTSLAQLTHRDVAASNDRTGAGSDWDLEVTTGTIDATPVLSAADEAGYAHDLATLTVTTNADSGAGSLRAEIAAAGNGDTITFASGMTISLSTHAAGDSLLVINKNLTIEGDIDGNGTADVILDGHYNGRVVDITAGSTVTLDGLVIEHGLLSGSGGDGTSAAALNGGDALGAGIRNAGSLTLKDVTVTGNRAAGGGGASFTSNNNVYGAGGTTYGFGGGGGGGYAGIGGGAGGAANITNPSGAGRTLGSNGIGGTGGQSFDYGGHGYGGGGGSTTGGVGAYQASTLGGGSGGTAGGIGGGGGGWGNTGGASGRGGDAAGGIFNSGTLTIRHSSITNNAAAGGGGAGPSFGGGSTYVAGAGGVAAGGILNRGSLQIDTATVASFSGNAAAGGERGELGSSNPSHPATTSQPDSMNDAGGSSTTLPSASITSATYNAATGVLTVTGTDMTAGDTIDAGKLTLTGQGGGSYTLTSGSVTASSGTTFSITLNAADKLAVNGLLDKNGTRSVDATTFNLAAAANWDSTAGASADLSGNGITVGNVASPTITSATYDANTHVLTVTGTGLVGTLGANNDITVSKLTLTGEGGATYTLTSANVEVTSATSFSVTLDATDRAQVEQMFNKDGTSSTGGTTYNLAAADDWDSVINDTDTSDVAGNGITVSNVAVPAITSATYDAGTGTVVVTGTGFLPLNGAANDIVADKFTFTGEGGATYTLTDTANVDITSGTSFTLVLSATDKAGVDALVNKDGTSSTGGTTYNLAAAEDWAAGADAAVVVADTTGNGITVSNVAVPAITSATYDASTGTVVVTGTGFLPLNGAANDIVADKFTFTGEGGATYTLTDTANVDITSGTSFTLVLSATDKAAIDRIVDKDGTSSAGGTTYNLAAAEDWAAGADAAVVVADTTGNGITASHVDATPVVTSSGGTTAFVEGTPVAVDGGLTLGDADNATLASATVALTGGFHAGQDVLSFANDGSTMGNITATYDAATGVATLTSAGGTATLAQWQAALRAVTYTDTSDDPDSSARTVSFTVNDGTRDSVAAAKAVSVTGVNDAPTVSAIANPAPHFTEGGSAVALFAGASINTVEAGQDIHALTVTVAGVADGAAEILSVDGTAVALTDGNSVTTATHGYTVAVTLAGGTATVAITRPGDYSTADAEALVNGLAYSNSSDNPTVAGGRTITLASIQDNGGTANGGVDTATPGIGETVVLTAVNDAPVVTTSGGAASFVAGDNVASAPVAVDGGLTVSDVDNTSLASATVSVTGGFHAGEDVLAFANDGTTMGNIAASYDSSTGVMTLTSAGGTATLTQWQAALRSVTYTDTAITPDAATRTVSFTVNDGTDDSTIATRAVTVTDVDQTPVVTATGGTTGYTGGAAAVTIDSGIAVSDRDNATLVSATASIDAGNFQAGDTLAFSNTSAATYGNIVGSYAATTGVLTLTSAGGTATLAQWQAALDAVTFSAGAATQPGDRAIHFAVSDGTKSSAVATDTVSVDAPPILTADAGSAAFVAGDNVAGTPVVVDGGITVTDLSSGTLASATASITGGFHAGEDVLSFTNDGATMGNIVASYNAATGALTLTSAGGTATLAQWQAALRSVTYTDTAITPDTTTRTVGFTAVDGNGHASATVARTVTVTDVDQTPIVTTTGGTTDYVGGTSAVTIDGGIVVSDLDNTSQSTGIVSIAGGFHTGDTLTFVNTNSTTFGNIVGSYNAATGVLTLTSSGATASNAQWAHALSAVTFSASGSATPGSRTIDFAINDGSKSSAVATDTVDVLGPPQITTDSGSTSFVAGDNTISTPVAIDAGLTVTDASSSTLASATIAITGNFHAGEDALSFTNDGATMGNIVASYNAATGVLTLTSAGATATLAQWQSALDSVTYTDTAVTPATTTRTVSFTAVDGAGTTSNTATRTITVTAVDQTPIVTTTGGTTDYVSSTVAVTIDGGITVSDLDNATQSSATVAIGAGFHSGDVLGFINTSSANFGNIVGSYNAATGVLTLTSSGATATDAQWSNALSSVTFSSASTSYGSRTIEFATNDGSKSSAVAIDTVDLLGLPKVTDVSSTTPDGSYKVGDTIYLTVTFDQAVVVDDAGGTPTLRMETGSIDHDAVYVSGSGSDTLTFAYTVQAGDASPDLDYASTSALTLDGGTIRSSAGVDAVLTLPATGGARSVAGQHAIVVDGIAPTVVSVDAPANGTYVAGQQLDFTVNYSEAVTVDTSGGTPRIAVTLDTGGTVYADYVSGSGTTALVFRYTVAAGQNDATGVTLAGAIDTHGGAIHDGVGNAEVDALNGVASTAAVLVDAVPPTASIALSDVALKVGDTSTVTITFSEKVVGLDVGDFTVDHGTLSGLATTDGGVTWTATFTPTADVTDASNAITLNNAGYTDTAGNAGAGTTTSPNYAIDTTRPTATIALSDVALKVGDTSMVTITFSEAVSGLDASDFTVDHGTLSGLATTDGGVTWTATFTPTANVTDASNVITLDNTGYTDAAGNTGTGTTASPNYAIDTARPTATIALSDVALKIGDTSTVTITFSEAVSGLDASDFTVDHGTLSGLATTDGGVTWTATFTPASNVTDTSNVITLDNTGYTDAAGNTGTGTTTSPNYAIDTARPTATIALSDVALKVGDTSTVTITFSEAVSGLDASDFTVDHGTLNGLVTTDGGVTWTATFTPSANVTGTNNVITLDNTGYTDTAGNTGTGTTTSPNYAIDTARPTATIALSDVALKVGDTSTVTITFSEAVSGLDASDFTVDHGTLSGLATTDGGVTWTAMFTPAANVTDTSNVIMLDNTGYTDTAGNTGTGTTTSPNYAIDTARPTATIALSDVALKVGDTSTVTITFSEAVSGLDASDFTVDHGTLSGLTTTDGGVTWTATFTPAANVTDASNVITLDSTGYTDAAGNTGASVAHSPDYAVDTQPPQLLSIARNDAQTNSGQHGVSYTITFSEDVTGLTTADLQLVLGGNAHASIRQVTAVDGHTYVVQLDHVGGTGSLRLDMAPTGIADLAGNPLAAGGQGEVYTIGGVQPVLLPPPEHATPPASPWFTPPALVPSSGTGALPTIDFQPAVPAWQAGGLAFGQAGDVSGLGGMSHVPPDHALPDIVAVPNVLPLDAGSAFALPLAGPAGRDMPVQVSLADGRPLPDWLHFDPVAGVLAGKAPAGSGEALVLRVVYIDGHGQVHARTLELRVVGGTPVHGALPGRHGADASVSPPSPLPAGKPPLHAQFGAVRQAGLVDHAALLRQLAVAQRHASTTVAP